MTTYSPQIEDFKGLSPGFTCCIQIRSYIFPLMEEGQPEEDWVWLSPSPSILMQHSTLSWTVSGLRHPKASNVTLPQLSVSIRFPRQLHGVGNTDL